MLFTNLTPVSLPGRFAGCFAAFALVALLAGTPAHAQSSNQSNPAPGTAPIQQPSSSSADQQPGQAAPGTAPMKSKQTAAALAPGKGPSYQNRWDIFGGLTYMNGQAGQNLPEHFNMGGGEGQFTYWIPGHFDNRLGVSADYRFGAGTTPVFRQTTFNRVLVMQHMFLGGAQWRGVRNRYVGINYHAFAGGAYGIFNHSTTTYPGLSPYSACLADQIPTQRGNLGLYCNGFAPWAAVGGSIDFNQGPEFAIRLSPDLTFEHFGTETREFFGISLGLVFRGARH